MMLVGIYYAIKDKNKGTMDTYYFGGKNMSPVWRVETVNARGVRFF